MSLAIVPIARRLVRKVPTLIQDRPLDGLTRKMIVGCGLPKSVDTSQAGGCALVVEWHATRVPYLDDGGVAKHVRRRQEHVWRGFRVGGAGKRLGV
ncbi:hypothetical protein B0H10DRAFT_200123 [Mycena sp. CBHHK59/15]|nr:hypothetical protein B0H10DRAFT_200123 [Mycena sp. CBHHK59/15]